MKTLFDAATAVSLLGDVEAQRTQAWHGGVVHHSQRRRDLQINERQRR